MVNKVILIGNLGADPEISYTQGGVAVARLSLATSETWKNKEGEKQEHTEWHRVVAFNRLAEIMDEHLKKGVRVYIEGRIQTRKWQDKEGIGRYITEIVAREMKMLSPKKGNGQAPPSMDGDVPLPEPSMLDDVPF